MSKRSGIGIIYFFVILSTLLLRVSTALGLPALIGADSSLYFTLVCQLFIFGFLPFAGYMIYGKTAKCALMRSFADDFALRGANLRNWLRTAVIAVCMVITATFVSYLWNGVLMLIGYKSSASPDVYNNVGDLFIGLTLTALLPGVFEEFAHRGLLYGAYRETGWRYVLISALAFALMHQNIRQTGYTFFDGAVIAMTVLYSGSVFTGMAIHVFNNAVFVFQSYGEQQGGFFSFIGRASDFFFGGIAGIVTFTLLAAAAGGLMCFMLSRMRRDAVAAGRIEQLPFAGYRSGVVPVHKDVFMLITFAIGIAATVFSFVWGVTA